ncbi:MAG TPA: helix-turn-helix transcriptional regulator [Clostridia bacterium]|nr:helix-turn-helix transcriptional regulator [Clostridia bacterium]
MRLWLRNRRIEENLTQSEVAELAGVDVTMINKVELGERRPSVEVAKKIATVLGFDWTRFYEEKQKDQQSA